MCLVVSSSQSLSRRLEFGKENDAGKFLLFSEHNIQRATLDTNRAAGTTGHINIVSSALHA